jgi:hypothetical protein
MTSEPGTLTGLIEDLEKLHSPEEGYAGEMCSECYQSPEPGTRIPEAGWWPCPTMEIVQRHKRAMYQIEESREPLSRWPYDFPDRDASHYRFDVKSGYVHWADVISGDGPDSWELHFKAPTVAECEAWIKDKLGD